MRLTIHKYEVPDDDFGEVFTLFLPIGARIIRYESQGHRLPGAHIWAIVDPDAATELRKFCIIGTGQLIKPGWEYIASSRQGYYLWHLFEVPS